AWGQQDGIIHPAPGETIVGTLEVKGAAGYRVPDAELSHWRNPADIEFGYFNSWSHMICRVQSITPDGDGAILTMAQPGFFLASHKAGVQAGMPAYMENALELLDEPGEWYFDRAERMLYYLPRPGENIATAEVIAPALTTLVQLQGSLDRPVHNLRFEGLTFAHATWLRPSELGHPDLQANFIQQPENCYMRPEFEKGVTSVNGEVEKSPANVVVDAGQAICFERCTFTALGGAGLDLQNGSQDNVVSGCRFEDISGSGLQVGGVSREDHHPSDPRRTVKGNRLTNNTITRIGVEYQDSVGIFCGYTDGTTIAHNEISNLPYTGITVGWGWGMPDAGGGGYTSPKVYDTPTTCRNNRIEYNHIHHVMLKRNDGGGIYTLSRQPGTILRGNHLHDNGPGGPGGLYLDEGSADIEVTGNLVYAVGRPMNYNDYAQNRNLTCREHDNVFGLLRTTDGVIGKALQGGSGSSFEVPHAAKLDTPQLTVEAWVRLQQFPNDWDPRRWAVCKAGNEWIDGNYSLCIDKNNVEAYLDIGGGRDNSFMAKSADGPLKLNTWCQIALTYDGDTLRLYCDGREVGLQKIGRARTLGTGRLVIGAREDGYSFFDGDIDEVRVYSRALSATELAHNADAVRGTAAGPEPEVVKDGLEGYWGFEDLRPAQDFQAIIDAAGLEAAYRK
ncbi:MAG: LamG-like jellyroll fold domain-containing protein, partial [Armatimonadota bacterium]